MKQIIKLFEILMLVFTISSCTKEGHVPYSFGIYNQTDTPITVHLSSWGDYTMYINGEYNSKYKFHEKEIINPHSFLMFTKVVADNPNPREIPPSLTPAWEYITEIECGGMTIPKEYFTNLENWDYQATTISIAGKGTNINLWITPELIEQLLQN